MEIDNRNRLRAEASLPLLDVPTEMARLKKAEDDAEFEKYFQLRRPEFKHLWADSSRGFLTNMCETDCVEPPPSSSEFGDKPGHLPPTLGVPVILLRINDHR